MVPMRIPFIVRAEVGSGRGSLAREEVEGIGGEVDGIGGG
jgi:hypothetical protein